MSYMGFSVVWVCSMGGIAESREMDYRRSEIEAVVSRKGVSAGLQSCMPKRWRILHAYIDWERWIGPVRVGR